MGAAKKLIDKKVLRDLVPINALSSVHIEEISKKAIIADVRSGRFVFKKGDRDYQSVYLLEGRIELLGDNNEVVSEVHAGSEAACHPLAHKQPRQFSARAVGNVTIACVDSSLLDVLLTWDQSSGYDVVEIDAQDDDDWMTRMLQSQAFLRLPPSNIHQLLMRLETITVSAGDAVVRQGDDGDYFYIVKSGRLSVTRKASSKSKEVALAELGEGACFGEEALVSGTKRNASVTMLTDGCLMRLAQSDFKELLCTPLVHEIDYTEAQKLIAEGAQWLDVRLPGEIENQAIKGAINLPLSALRDQASELDDSITYIVCCDTGRRSAAGAFVLSQNGLTVYTLKNGLMDLPEEMLTRARDPVAETKPAREAEIIQFDSDTEAQTAKKAPGTGRAAGDLAGVSQAALAELNGKLKAVTSQLADKQKEISESATAHAADRAAIQQLQQQKNTLEQELQQTRKECENLVEKLQKQTETRASSQGERDRMVGNLEKAKQTAEKRLSEVEKELEQVRGDYQQLGQRTSALGGERDALFKELEKARATAQELEQRLDSKHEQDSSRVGELERQLEEREQALRQASEQRVSLESRIGELETRCHEQDGLLNNATAQAEQWQSEKAELESKLQSRANEVGEIGSALKQAQEREQALCDQMQQAARSAEENLLQFNADAIQAQDALNKRIAELEHQLVAEQEQFAGQVSKYADVENKFLAIQEQLDEVSGREQSAREELQDAVKNLEKVRDDLQQAGQDAATLQQQLADAQAGLQMSEQKVVGLESRNKELADSYESDISTARSALARAQDERENVKREQTRLMEALRKAEKGLAEERNNHETEVYRLRKELKEAAGESNAGLAAELEVLQTQLSEGGQQREELEIRLGERSKQLEEVQVKLEKAEQRLLQAQDSARQAEQQLVEANQAVSEEMTVRLDAEQKIQQELRANCEQLVAERDEQRERNTVLDHEMEELRAALKTVESSRDALELLQQQFNELQRHSEMVEDERDRARQAEQSLQQEADRLRAEADRLRAEAEVTRGLMDMAPGTENDAEVRDQLVESRRNVEVAVRLRREAETRVAELEQELILLRKEIETRQTDTSAEPPALEIPSLDDEDPQDSAFLDSDFSDYSPGEPLPAGQDDVSEQATDEPEFSFVAAADGSTSDRSGNRWRRVFAGLIGCVVFASATIWWFSQKPGLESQTIPGANESPVTIVAPEPEPQAVDSEVSNPEVVIETPVVQMQPEEAVEKPPVVMAVEKPADPIEPSLPDAPVSSAPPPLPDPEPVAPVAGQPAGSFSDRLENGTRGPTMVELRADRFEMGSGSLSLNFNERPRHEVKLARFAIGKHEVTFDEYERFARATGRSRPNDSGWGRGDRPVINISWQDATAYAQWLSQQTGQRYRLPTEAEWEFVARSGSFSRFSWGNEVGEGMANCFDCGSEFGSRSTMTVGSFPANEFGVHDMAGNVREWVRDCSTPNYDGAPGDGAAVEIPGCKERIVRGGGYSSPSDKLRSSARGGVPENGRFNDLGFRVAREF